METSLFPLSPTVAVGLEVVLKVTLLLAVAGLATSLLRRSSASTRHFVWGLALISSVVMPALTLLPSVELSLPSALSSPSLTTLLAPTAPASTIDRSPAPALPVDDLWAMRSGQSWTSPRHAQKPLAVEATAPTSRSRLTPFGLPLVWALGASLILARLGVGLRRAAGLVRRGRVLESPEILTSLARRLGMLHPPQLVMSTEVDVPLTCGLTRPTLLVPVEFRDWSTARQEIVLSHELAHIRRHDCLIQLVGQLACALYWFHPLVWHADHRLRREAEQAADDVVIDLGARASEYAAHLLAIVRSLTRTARVSSIATVSMAGTSFEERVSAILEPNRKRGPMPRMSSFLAAVPLLCGVGLLGAVQVAATPSDCEHNVAANAVDENVPFGAESGALSFGDGGFVLASGNEQHGHHHDGADHDIHWENEHEYESERMDNPGAQAFKTAYEHYREKQFAVAADGFGKAAEMGFRPATSLYNLACCQALMDKTDQAIDSLGRAIAAGFDGSEIETDSDLRSLRGEAGFLKLRDAYRARQMERAERGEHVDNLYAETMAKLAHLKTDKVTDGDDWYDVGMALHRLGEWRQATEAWERGMELGADKSTSTYNIACSLALEGEVRLALDKLSEAVELGYGSPQHMDKDTDLDALRNEPRFKQIRATAELLELPSFATSNENRAFMAPAWAAAAKRYDAHLANNPNSGRAWFNLGFATLASDQMSRAADAFNRSFELGFRPALSAYNMACSYARMDDKDRAFQWLDKARELSDGKLMWHVASDSDLDSLRDDPRFPDVDAIKMQHEMKIKAKKAEAKARKAAMRAMKAKQKQEMKQRERSTRY